MTDRKLLGPGPIFLAASLFGGAGAFLMAWLLSGSWWDGLLMALFQIPVLFILFVVQARKAKAESLARGEARGWESVDQGWQMSVLGAVPDVQHAIVQALEARGDVTIVERDVEAGLWVASLRVSGVPRDIVTAVLKPRQGEVAVRLTSRPANARFEGEGVRNFHTVHAIADALIERFDVEPIVRSERVVRRQREGER